MYLSRDQKKHILYNVHSTYTTNISTEYFYLCWVITESLKVMFTKTSDNPFIIIISCMVCGLPILVEEKK